MTKVPPRYIPTVLDRGRNSQAERDKKGGKGEKASLRDNVLECELYSIAPRVNFPGMWGFVGSRKKSMWSALISGHCNECFAQSARYHPALSSKQDSIEAIVRQFEALCGECLTRVGPEVDLLVPHPLFDRHPQRLTSGTVPRGPRSTMSQSTI